MCRNILIVDDDDTMRLTLKLNLRANHNVYEAQNGCEMLKVLEQQSIDIIILDYELPDLNGLDIVKLLKVRPLLKEIPIILISGHDKLELIGKAYEHDIPLFIRKVDLNNLDINNIVDTITTIQQFLGE